MASAARGAKGAAAFAAGLGALPRAFALLLRERSLWPLVGLPLLLNLLVGGLLTVGLLVLGFQGLDWLIAHLPPGLTGWDARFGAALVLLLRGLVTLLVLLAVGLLVGRVGVVLGAPFYAALAERIERLVLPMSEQVPGQSGHAAFVRDIGRALAYELKKLGLVLGVWAIALPLQLIPVVGAMLGLALGFAVATLLVCLDAFDPPLERRRLGFRQKLGAVGAHLPLVVGFGIPAGFLCSVPFLNLLAFPLVMAAGTLLYCERLHPALGRPDGHDSVAT